MYVENQKAPALCADGEDLSSLRPRLTELRAASITLTTTERITRRPANIIDQFPNAATAMIAVLLAFLMQVIICIPLRQDGSGNITSLCIALILPVEPIVTTVILPVFLIRI